MSGLVRDLYDFALPMRPASRYRFLAYIATTIGLAGFFLISQQLEPALSRSVSLLSCLLVIGGISMGFSVPIIWLTGFVILLILHQPSDPVFANAGANKQLRETYYIVVRPFWFYLVPLIPLVVGAIYHWLPRLSTYRYNEYLGSLHAWMTVIGLAMIFAPLKIIALNPFPHYLEYPEFFELMGRIAWSGIVLIALGVLLFAYVVFDLFRRKRPA